MIKWVNARSKAGYGLLMILWNMLAQSEERLFRPTTPAAAPPPCPGIDCQAAAPTLADPIPAFRISGADRGGPQPNLNITIIA